MKHRKKKLLTASAVLAGLACCHREKRVEVYLSKIQIKRNAVQVTSDPEEKNRLLRERSGTHTYQGMEAGLSIPRDRAPKPHITETAGFKVSSRDEGIILQHPAVCDSAPEAIAKQNRYELFFSGGAEGGECIFRCLSSDGYLWNKLEVIVEPSSSPGSEIPPDSVHNRDPAVIRVNSDYHLYYTGTDNGTVDNEIFLATSAGGVTWTKYSEGGPGTVPTAVIPNKSPDKTYGIGQPSVTYKDGTFYLYYTDRRKGKQGLWLALSEDGVHFRNHRRVVRGIGNADVKYCPELEVFLMVYGEVADEHIYWNISEDGVAWPEPLEGNTIAAGPPETIHHSPTILSDTMGRTRAETRIFYSGGISRAGSWRPKTWEIESTRIRVLRK